MSTVSKVKEVKEVGSYDGQFGTMWNYLYTMEDGTVIKASHKKQKSYQIGDEVQYLVKKEHPTYGKQGTVGLVNGGAGGYVLNRQDNRIEHALTCACTLLVNCPEFPNKETVLETAKMILEVRSELTKNLV